MKIDIFYTLTIAFCYLYNKEFKIFKKKNDLYVNVFKEGQQYPYVANLLIFLKQIYGKQKEQWMDKRTNHQTLLYIHTYTMYRAGDLKNLV